MASGGDATPCGVTRERRLFFQICRVSFNRSSEKLKGNSAARANLDALPGMVQSSMLTSWGSCDRLHSQHGHRPQERQTSQESQFLEADSGWATRRSLESQLLLCHDRQEHWTGRSRKGHETTKGTDPRTGWERTQGPHFRQVSPVLTNPELCGTSGRGPCVYVVSSGWYLCLVQIRTYAVLTGKYFGLSCNPPLFFSGASCLLPFLPLPPVVSCLWSSRVLSCRLVSHHAVRAEGPSIYFATA